MSSSLKLSAPEHPIKAVTVYKSSRAEVVRVFRIELQSGTTNIQINELPTCVDTQSVRVSGLGAEAKLLNVACTTGTHGAPSVPKAAVSATKRMREDATALLRSYAETLSGELISPTLMTDFIGSLVQSDNERLAAVAEIDARLASIDHQIEEELEKDALRKRHAMGLVTVDIGSDKPMNIELTLTYIVSNASWSIAYELRASTDENGKPSSSVSLHYRPRIVQTTGEDWTNIALTLSTGDTTVPVQHVPELQPRTIRAHGASFSKPSALNNTDNDNNTGGPVFGLSGFATSVRAALPTIPTSLASGGNGGFSSYAGAGAMPFGTGAGQTTTHSLFTTSTASTPIATVTIFGEPASKPKPTFGSTSWFGTSTSKIQPGTFGAGGAAPSTATTAATGIFANSPPTASVFGTLANTNATTGTTTTGIFGRPSTGSLFGSPTTTTTGNGGVLFGAPQPATSAFGQPAFNLFKSTNASQSATATATAASSQPPFVMTAPPPPPEPQTQADSDSEDFEEIAVPDSQTATTESSTTAFAASYSVEGKLTIPSDGTTHQVCVASLPLEATITYICTPRIDARVYLQASVKNTSEYRLLAGPVSVLVDDGFVSRTEMHMRMRMPAGEVAPGETFVCMLGDDAGVQVTSETETKAQTSGLPVVPELFAEARSSTTTTTKIGIHNKHAFPLADLVVRDVVPTSEDARVKVVLRKPAGLADSDTKVETEDGVIVRWGKTADGRSGEKEGRIEWVCSVGALKKVELEMEYEVRATVDVNWVEYVAPLSG
ncbi:hypothetical protein HMN09_01237200 [Mycena chlorophos]|uniref:DUF4139 domain-containing protein n=1 Tax=Mycena chlorophos TaxID=658473 RepID=A0A8H6S4A4_MYCCL|nr:hypothetical protein HMN09_01237200 [Mycena chlorophos]